MKKDTPAYKSHKEQLKQKVEQELLVIEDTVRKLLDGLPIETLQPMQRLFMASRFIALHQNAIKIDNALEQPPHENKEKSAVINIIDDMRIEESPDIVDADTPT